MERKSIAFELLSDIYGFRILVRTVPDCYAAVGVAHTTWPTVPGRFKDYISTPKQNDYRSIHTTVIGPSSQRVELQIRTREMHEVAEYGIAAHALYRTFPAGNPRQRKPRLPGPAPDDRIARRRRQFGRFPRTYETRTLPGSGLLLHAKGPSHRPAEARRPSISLMPSTPTSEIPRSERRSTGASRL